MDRARRQTVTDGWLACSDSVTDGRPLVAYAAHTAEAMRQCLGAGHAGISDIAIRGIDNLAHMRGAILERRSAQPIIRDMVGGSHSRARPVERGAITHPAILSRSSPRRPDGPDARRRHRGQSPHGWNLSRRVSCRRPSGSSCRRSWSDLPGSCAASIAPSPTRPTFSAVMRAAGR
jgi:hypothetical protein